MAWQTKFHLTERQFNEILSAEQQVKNHKLLKKIQCIKLKNIGWKHEKVADFLWVKIPTITARTKLFLKWWITKLLERNYAWKISILSLEQLEKLAKRNKEKSFESAKEAKDFIEKTYHITFHLHWVQKLLKKNFACHSKSKK